MFELRRAGIDTHSEHVVFIHERAVRQGLLGIQPMDRVRILGKDAGETAPREVIGVVNYCSDSWIAPNQIALSEAAFQDLGLPEDAEVEVTLARPPESVRLVRGKLRGARLSGDDFDRILGDVVARRYSKPELSMFVLACALRNLDDEEIVDFTRAMVDSGSTLHFDAPVVADKHCIGGIPGNRTTMVLVPILVSLGLVVPKTSSLAITSPAGTADTMSTLARVDLSAEEIHKVVDQTGGCISWGGALDLAPADDVLITVERPMEIDTEAQLVASILAKKKTVGATHVLIDIPVGPSAKVRSQRDAARLSALFQHVAQALDLGVDIITTEARGPVGNGVGPRLEALDVLSVLRGDPGAPTDLREKSLFLAGRLLEQTDSVPGTGGYRAAAQALDSGAALQAFEAIATAQGRRTLPPAARHQRVIEAPADGRIRGIDCSEINRIAKLAGAPANPAAGVRVRRGVGEVVQRGEPIFEIHAESATQLDFAGDYACLGSRDIYHFGY